MTSTRVYDTPSEFSTNKRCYGDGVPKYVSDHLIYEILLKAPVESLLVFKSVCKAWYSMIKDPNFAKQHCDHHVTKEQSTALVSLVERGGDICDLTNIKNLGKTKNVVGNPKRQHEQLMLPTDEGFLKITSCNGLVCFHREYPLQICNPVTRELVKLPKPGIDEDKEVATGCGLGFDAMHNEYKVIQLFCGFDGSGFGYEVLTLGTAMSWRRPIQQNDVLTHPQFIQEVQEVVFVEGSLYWYAANNILCFDVTTERFKLIQLPDVTNLNLELVSRYSFVSGFDKSLSFLIHDMTREMLHIWKMQRNCVEKEKTIWIPGCSIDVSFISDSEHEDTHITLVCSQGKKIYLRYKNRYRNGLACYDAEYRTFKVPGEKGSADDIEFVAYTKSILCLKDIVGSSHVSLLWTIVNPS